MKYSFAKKNGQPAYNIILKKGGRGETKEREKKTYICMDWGTEKTVDRSIVLQPIANVVKLELVADSIFIGRHCVERWTLLDSSIHRDCWRIDEKTFRFFFFFCYIVRWNCNEAGLKLWGWSNVFAVYSCSNFFFFFILFKRYCFLVQRFFSISFSCPFQDTNGSVGETTRQACSVVPLKLPSSSIIRETSLPYTCTWTITSPKMCRYVEFSTIFSLNSIIRWCMFIYLSEEIVICLS